ncbi:MAG: hypothetical protein IPL52_01490 [Flavobacteriales bacterium]|nr:hypothetical protein [Flavobacteriales bacterium]
MTKLITFLAIAIAAAAQAQTFTNWHTSDGLPTDDLRDVAIAPDGNIWIATGNGVAMFDGTTFTTHNTTTHPGLASNDVMAVAVMSNGDVWAGTDFGASRFDGSTYTTYTIADGLGDNEVRNIKQAPNGDIWFATINGATKYNGGTFTEYTTPNIPFGGALHTAFATNGDVWISGGLGGAIEFDGSTFAPYSTGAGLVSNRVRGIAIDGAGNKWVGTAEGISVLDASNVHTGNHTRPFIMAPPDTLNPITDVHVDDHGRIWAGIYVDYLVTVGGVSVYDGTVWTQFEESDGLAGPNVRRMAISSNDDVWVTTSTGLTRISDVNIGIAESEARSFSLFPNPASSTIEIALLEETANARLEVRDAIGRVVLVERIAGMRAHVDVSALPVGFYHARIGARSVAFAVAR